MNLWERPLDGSREGGGAPPRVSVRRVGCRVLMRSGFL